MFCKLKYFFSILNFVFYFSLLNCNVQEINIPEWKWPSGIESSALRLGFGETDKAGWRAYSPNERAFSHFIWKGNDAITAWAAPDESGANGFYFFPDKTKRCRQVGKDIMVIYGHVTYVPYTNYQWILNDTYPQGEECLQELYLFHVPTGRKMTLGKFHEPKNFVGEWRCYVHPRCDQQGKRVFFDSTHEGGTRQVYMIDISGIIGIQ